MLKLTSVVGALTVLLLLMSFVFAHIGDQAFSGVNAAVSVTMAAVLLAMNTTLGDYGVRVLGALRTIARRSGKHGSGKEAKERQEVQPGARADIRLVA